MGHPDADTMLRYLLNRASSDEQLEVDTHLAQCAPCLQRIRAWSYLEENLDQLWDSWTAVEHGRTYRRWRLAKALKEAAVATPVLAESVWRWIENLKQGLEFSLRVLVDPSRAIASLGTCVVPAPWEFRLNLSGVGIGAPDEQAQLESHLQRGSQLLSDDKTDEAANELLQALQIDARSPQAAVSQVLWEGQLLCQTIVDSRRGRILVKLWPQEGCALPSLALLVPEDEDEPVIVATFRQVEDEPYLLAEFNHIDHVNYVLQIEPPTPRS